MYKNIEKKQIMKLEDLVEYQEGQVVSKTLVQNVLVSVTVFSFDKGEEISTHASGGDAMVTVLDGKGKFTIGEPMKIAFAIAISLCEFRLQYSGELSAYLIDLRNSLNFLLLINKLFSAINYLYI